MQVLIIGGGASGMMAALSASENPENQVTILERQNRVGKKLMATGNGRCNLTNRNLTLRNFHGTDAGFAEKALSRFPVDATLDYFAQLGLYTVTEEDGKVYPLSDQANSVVDTLRFALSQRGVTVITGCDVLSVRKKARGYKIVTTGEEYDADNLIITAGGCAGKTLGGTRSGYKLLESLGHRTTSLHPVLVQVKTDLTYVRSLKGVRADCAMTLKENGKTLAVQQGEVQFTDFGVSGPVTFSLSRLVSLAQGEQLLLLDFLRNYSENEIYASLSARCGRFPKLEVEQLLTGMLNPRLGLAVLKFSQLDLKSELASLTEDSLKKIAHNLKFFPLQADGTLGMEHAQVTAGGVLTCDFRADTLESRKAPGVFVAGEVLDIDGDCGGYNLQWAWSSGYVAGKLGGKEG